MPPHRKYYANGVHSLKEMKTNTQKHMLNYELCRAASCKIFLTLLAQNFGSDLRVEQISTVGRQTQNIFKSFAGPCKLCTLLRSCGCRRATSHTPELIPVLGSQRAGDRSHKPGGRLPFFPPDPRLHPSRRASPPIGRCQIILLGEIV